MIRHRQFETGDLDKFKFLNLEGTDIDVYSTLLDLDNNPSSFLLITILDKEDILGIISFELVHRNILQAAYYPSEKSKSKGKLVIDICLEVLDHWLYNSKIHRIESFVKLDFQKGEKFLNILGFSFEGIAYNYYGNGEDLKRFSLVRRK